MKPQTIVTTTGERLVVLTEADYEALVEAAEVSADLRAIENFHVNLAAGEEELVPAAVVDRLLDGESRIKVWREYRGLTSQTLAEHAGVAQDFLVKIEAGEHSAPRMP